MRALAEFIMRGRTQASVVALIGSWLPLISPATVGLVSLRRGASDGVQILLWASLPALVALAISQMAPLMVLVTLAGLTVTYLVALLLRMSASWPQLLAGLVLLSSLMSVMMLLLVPESIQQVTQSIGDMLAEIQAQNPQAGEFHIPDRVFVLGLIAYVIAMNGLLSLLLARWWQALLYNPGGFQAEFHQLRLKPVAAIASFVATLACWQLGLDYQMWGYVFMLPLLLSGVALVHNLAARRQVALPWLVLFYLALIMVGPLMVLLLIIAFMDTWLNFRERLAPRS